MSYRMHGIENFTIKVLKAKFPSPFVISNDVTTLSYLNTNFLSVVQISDLHLPPNIWS
jgi:hypothetical protein